MATGRLAAQALLIVAPFFINKLIYACWPSYQVFLVTDYACHILALGLVYLCFGTARLRFRFHSVSPFLFENSWRSPCRQLVLIGVNVVVLTPFDISMPTLGGSRGFRADEHCQPIF